jgi:hypothetical protein
MALIKRGEARQRYILLALLIGAIVSAVILSPPV